MTTAEAQWITVAIMLFVIAALIVGDFFLIRSFGTEASISYVVGIGFQRYPLLLAVALFAAGCFFGHAHLPVVSR